MMRLLCYGVAAPPVITDGRFQVGRGLSASAFDVVQAEALINVDWKVPVESPEVSYETPVC